MDKKNLVKIILGAILVFITLFLIQYDTLRVEDLPTNNEQPQDLPTTGNQLEFDFGEELSMLSFNIQVFGRTKASKPEVMQILVDIIMQYDLVAIQEVRDSSGTAVQEMMSYLPNRYDMIIGPREGRSRSKEQYWFIYDTMVVEVLGDHVYQDEDDVFERNPYSVFFKSVEGDFDFVVMNKHVAPGDADAEIEYTPQVVAVVEDYFNEPDIIIVGDFNADGSYYDEEELINVFPPNQYSIIIPNTADTTVADSDNTYDRIIITDDAIEDFSGDWGVYYFEEYYDFLNYSIEPKEVSDHYPVWAVFNVLSDSK